MESTQIKSEVSLFKIPRKTFLKALILLGTILLMTIFFALHLKRDAEVQAKKEFVLVCNEIKTRIHTRLHAHAQLLRDGSSFFAASDTVTRKEWKAFIDHSKLNRNLPGIQGVGYSIIVQRNQLQDHLQKIRAEGFPQYTIKPEGERELYTSIIYLEPFVDRNLRAFGYDMFSDTTRRKAMEMARDFDVAALSGKVTLVQETNQDLQAGSLMYVPVYRNGKLTKSIEERRAAIVGWVYSPYRMDDLMKGILGRWDSINEARIQLKIYDNADISSKALLFDSQKNDTIINHSAHLITHSLPLVFNGKKWTLYFSQSNEKQIYFTSKIFIVIIGGISISILLFALFLLFANAKKRMKLAEQLALDLQNSKSKFQSLYMNMTEGAALHEIIFDSKGIPEDYRIIETNPAFSEILCLNRENFIGKTSREAYQINEPPYFEIYKEVCQTGEPKSFETFFPPLNKYFNISVYRPYKGSFATIFKDITEQKRSEEILKDSEVKFRNLIKDMQVGVLLQGPKSEIVLSNPKALEFLGLTEDQLLGKTSFDPDWNVIHEDGSPFPGNTHPVPESIETRQPVRNVIMGVYRPVARDRVWLMVDAEPQLNLDGTIRNVVCSFVDISKRKQAEEELKESEKKFRELFEANSDGITIFRLMPNGQPTKILAMNDNAAKMVGYTKEEMIQMSPNDFEKDITFERIEMRKMEILTKGYSNFETTLSHKDGSQINVEIKVSAINYENQLALMNIVRDITGRKKIESEIKNQNEELQRLNATKDKFFSIIAHDLRSPFNSFLGLTQIIAEELPNLTMAKVQEIGLIMRKSATNLYRMLENLLQSARIQQGSIPFNPEEILIKNVVEESIAMIIEAAKNKGIEIVVNVPDEMKVIADNNILQTVIRNLVSNAVKFTNKGGTVHILGKEFGGKGVEISVQDSGIGMSQKIIDNLFRIDVQTSRKGTEGELSTGLGLVLCKEFIEKHGGEILIESEEGIGSVFSFTIPNNIRLNESNLENKI